MPEETTARNERAPRAGGVPDEEVRRVPEPSRRAFLGWTLGALGVAIAGVVSGVAISAARRPPRIPVTLPTPTATEPLPPGADLGIDGLSPIITPAADFYRTDTAFIIPDVDPADWSLRIHGLVEEEVTLSWDELLALPFAEHVVTLMCVSNPVGGDLIGTASWLGTPIHDLLARARPTAGADMVLSTSVDGFTASTPLAALQDPDRSAVLAIGMNGEPLSPVRGAPVRMVVAGLYGYVSATKWVTDLEVTTFAAKQAYWTLNGWAEQGPVKLESRIDVPRANARLTRGAITVAGVAWHQHVGIGKVEFQVDGGPWQPTELSAPINDDTWVQWSGTWDARNAADGQHQITVRATGADGEVQTDVVASTVPDGATGLDYIAVYL